MPRNCHNECDSPLTRVRRWYHYSLRFWCSDVVVGGARESTNTASHFRPRAMGHARATLPTVASARHSKALPVFQSKTRAVAFPERIGGCGRQHVATSCGRPRVSLLDILGATAHCPSARAQSLAKTSCSVTSMCPTAFALTLYYEPTNQQLACPRALRPFKREDHLSSCFRAAVWRAAVCAPNGRRRTTRS